MDKLFERRTDHHWDTRICNTGQQPARFQGFCTTPQPLPTLPHDATHTTVYSTQIGRHQGIQPIQQIAVVTTDKAWWNEPVHLPDNIAPLINGITNGTAICVTDGSYKTNYGTAALILLSTLEAPEGVTLVNQTPGERSNQDAYRAEVGGIYGCIAYANHLANIRNITDREITLACDCWSALLNVFIHSFDSPSQAQYDLIHACRLRSRNSPIKWKPHHVKGHQDDDIAYAELLGTIKCQHGQPCKTTLVTHQPRATAILQPPTNNRMEPLAERNLDYDLVGNERT
jgi:hypothetical protein